jgi:hypothetical protein
VKNYIGWVDANGDGRRALTDDVGDEDEPTEVPANSPFLAAPTLNEAFEARGFTVTLLGGSAID